MKIFLCSSILLTVATKMKSRTNERGKGNEFVSQMSFPFSRRAIPSSNLKQFRVIQHYHDSDDKYNVVY